MEYDYTSLYDKCSKKQKDRINKRSSYFNGSTHLLSDIDNIKKYIIEFPFYAYIMHKPDNECDKPHIHVLIYSRGGNTRVKDVCEKLHCDYGDIQSTRNQNYYARYMLHLGFSDKPDKYDISEVVTNDVERFRSFLSDIVPSVDSIFEDFCNLRSGRISRKDFVVKYSSEIYSMSFYQKIRTFSEIDRVAKY